METLDDLNQTFPQLHRKWADASFSRRSFTRHQGWHAQTAPRHTSRSRLTTREGKGSEGQRASPIVASWGPRAARSSQSPNDLESQAAFTGTLAGASHERHPLKCENHSNLGPSRGLILCQDPGPLQGRKGFPGARWTAQLHPRHLPPLSRAIFRLI